MLSVWQKGVNNVLAENELCVYLPILLWKKKQQTLRKISKVTPRDLNHTGNSSSVYLFNSNNTFFTIVVPNFSRKSDFENSKSCADERVTQKKLKTGFIITNVLCSNKSHQYLLVPVMSANLKRSGQGFINIVYLVKNAQKSYWKHLLT